MFFEEISLFTRRAHEKNKKHLNGCINLGRHFIPLVFSSLGGLGPPESVEYLDRLYAHAYATELRLGGNGSDTHHQRTIFYQTLQAILANQSTTMIQTLTRYLPPDAQPHNHGVTPLHVLTTSNQSAPPPPSSANFQHIYLIQPHPHLHDHIHLPHNSLMHDSGLLRNRTPRFRVVHPTQQDHRPQYLSLQIRNTNPPPFPPGHQTSLTYRKPILHYRPHLRRTPTFTQRPHRHKRRLRHSHVRRHFFLVRPVSAGRSI